MKQNISYRLNLIHYLKKNNNLTAFLRIINSYLLKYIDIRIALFSVFFEKSLFKKKRVLFATGVGVETVATKFESTLASYLKVNNIAECDFFLCDSSLKACQYFKYNTYNNDIFWILNNEKLKKKACDSCFKPAKIVLSKIGKVFKTSDFGTLSNDTIKEIENLSFEQKKIYTYNGYKCGEQATAGALRYLCVGNLENTPINNEILNKYLYSAVLFAFSIEKLLTKQNYDSVICNHGVYVPHGITVSVCKKLGIPIKVWNLSYRKNTFMMSSGDTYHHTLLNDNSFLNYKFTKIHKKKILNYLYSRISGKDDWLSFQKKDNLLKSSFALLNINKKNFISTTTLVTNVIWDAQIHFKDNIFINMSEWIIETIKFYIKNNNRLLIIRVHPAEMRGVLPTREKVSDIISKNFNSLPDNIIFLDWDHKISSYDCAYETDFTIIYGTKMGIELSALGKPVVVTGDAWVKNKGFAIQPKDKFEYFNLLFYSHKIKINENQKELALRYAYWFFFLNSIDVDSLIHLKNLYPPFRFPYFNLKKRLINDIGLHKFQQKILNEK